MSRNVNVENFPKYEILVESAFKALIALGGSGSNNEILETVIKMLRLPDSVVDELHKGTQRTELDYLLAWAKSDLKKYGAISNDKRGVWAIKSKFANQSEIDAEKVLGRKRSAGTTQGNIKDEKTERTDVPEELEPWREKLAKKLHEMNPYAFERFTQRLLRESGFSQVQVTKKSSDGGIDGTGKFLIKGIFSFNVAFQCKRYSGNVSPKQIRDFRGSLTADIEKGLFITTGTFSRAAKAEAAKAGKQQIDLIDGEELINILSKNKIGVRGEKTITTYEIDEEFFKEFSE